MLVNEDTTNLSEESVRFPCDLCDLDYSLKSNLLHHQVLKHGGASEAAKNLQNRTFECSFCKKKIANPWKHKKFCKSNPANQPKGIDSQTTDNFTSNMKLSFSNYESEEDYKTAPICSDQSTFIAKEATVRISVEPTLFACDLCDLEYNWKQNLLCHQVTKHGVVTEAAKNLQKGFFECPFCKKWLTDPWKHKEFVCKLNPAKQPNRPHPQRAELELAPLDKISSDTKNYDERNALQPPDRRCTRVNEAEVEEREQFVLERFTTWLIKFDNKTKSTAEEYCKIIQKMATFWRRNLSRYFTLKYVEIQYLFGVCRIPCSEMFVHSLDTNDLKQLALSSYIALCSYAKFKIEQQVRRDPNASDEWYAYLYSRFRDVENVSVEASSALEKLTRKIIREQNFCKLNPLKQPNQLHPHTPLISPVVFKHRTSKRPFRAAPPSRSSGKPGMKFKSDSESDDDDEIAPMPSAQSAVIGKEPTVIISEESVLVIYVIWSTIESKIFCAIK